MDELEFVLKKIVEIDNKSTDVKTNTNQIVNDKVTSLELQLEELDEEWIGKSKMELEQRHATAIAECEEKAKVIKEECEENRKILLQKYSEIKDALKQIVINEIIES